MYSTIIKQLEKALSSKDDKELRLRVEVLLDMIKDQQPQIPVHTAPVISGSPETTTNYQVSGQSSPKVNGAGSIVSTSSEQINYKRPKGT